VAQLYVACRVGSSRHNRDLVNSPKTDNARCIEPVVIDRDFFERQWWGDEGES
jgi:hypothetical protein